MTKTKQSGGNVGRSSISGRFVTVEYAKKLPKTTEVEKIKAAAEERQVDLRSFLRQRHSLDRRYRRSKEEFFYE